MFAPVVLALASPAAAGDVTAARVAALLAQRGISPGSSQTVRSPDGSTFLVTVVGLKIRTVGGAARVTAEVTAREVPAGVASAH